MQPYVTAESLEERAELRRQMEAEYAAKSEQLHVIHKLLQAHAMEARLAQPTLVIQCSVGAGGACT